LAWDDVESTAVATPGAMLLVQTLDDVMPIVDAQVHVWERDHPDRPWAGAGHGPAEVTGEATAAMMDRFGVDGAILVSPWSVYRFDPAYALEVAARYPTRFAVVAPVDPHRLDVRDFVREWHATPHAVGLRLMVLSDADLAGLRLGHYDALLQAVQDFDVPLCVGGFDQFEQIAAVARRFPELRIVLDHLGLTQPSRLPDERSPFDDLPRLLSLASLPNVALKVTGAPTLSGETYPFRDMWPPLHQLVTAFGLDRMMWGTDWTRTTDILSFEEGIRCFRDSGELAAAELALLMGGTACEIFHWSPAHRPSHSAPRAGYAVATIPKD
jgi:L-fuconolactonase